MATTHNDKQTSNTIATRTTAASTPSTIFVKPFWQAATWWGMRRLIGSLPRNVGAYKDTITHFETNQPVIALTIDDGLCRGDDSSEKSMVKEVQECLEKYDAHATFFICTDYLKGQQDEARELLAKGHELGNHLEADKAFHYNRLSKEEFRTVLQETNAILNEVDQASHRWFRAPQLILTKNMAQVLEEEEEKDEGGTNMTHALCDCYCDDWSFAQDVDGSNTPIQKRKQVMKQVANLLLSQVQPGSIALIHMPQRGFREGALDALEYFLQGVQEKGYKCVNLTEMQELVAHEEQSQCNIKP